MPKVGPASPKPREAGAHSNNIAQRNRLGSACGILAAVVTVAARVPSLAVVKVDNAQHELLNERDELREQFWAAFDSLIDEAVDQGLRTGNPPVKSIEAWT
jgi:hypothetical protein